MELKKVPADEKIDKRNGGCGVIFENKLYVWGGNGTDVCYPYRNLQNDDSDSDSDDDSDEEEVDPNKEVKIIVTLPRPKSDDHPFDVLDLATNEWFRQPTGGDYPSLGLGSSLRVHQPSHSIILFSGFKDVRFDDEVYKVSPNTLWVWEKVQLASEIKPRERYLTGVIIHGDRMCVFGGVGRASRDGSDPITRQQDPGAKYVGYVEGGVPRDYGWTSEYMEFNINANEWTAPLHRNAFRPDQLGAHAFSKFDSHRAVLFGGNGSNVYSNACYIFDLDTRVWTGPYNQEGEKPWPVATRFSTLTSLVDPERVGQEMYEGCGEILQPRMVLLWGKTSQIHISTETWLLQFDFDNRNPLVWTQLRIGVEPRSWHIAEPVYPPNTTCCDIVVFGGNMYKHPGTESLDRDNAASLQILHFGLASLMELCLNAVVSSEELMACAELRYPGYKAQQITKAHSKYINCPLTTDITSF